MSPFLNYFNDFHFHFFVFKIYRKNYHCDVHSVQTPKRANKITKLGTIVNKTTIRIVEKCVSAQFTTTWIPTIIKEVGDKFH